MLGIFEQKVLMALIRLGKSPGVPIVNEIETRTGREPTVGQLYTTLGRLERKGYVKWKLGDPTPERGGRAKKYFEITGHGRTVLRESLRAAVDFAGELGYE